MRRTDKYIIFWGGIYSNWAMTPFRGQNAYPILKRMLDEIGIQGQDETLEITRRLRGKRYESVEQWMMSCKAWLMGDLDTLKMIHDTRSPKEAQTLGKKVKPFDARLWDKTDCAVVTSGIVAKFSVDDRMRGEILNTGGLRFVEGSKIDRKFGIGIDWRDHAADDSANWRGRNLLGQCLDRGREIISEM